jgi:hypothetical protein
MKEAKSASASVSVKFQKILHSFNLEHQLKAHDNFVELIIAKLRTHGAKIRPRVNIISHQLNRIAVGVVIEPSQAVEPPAAGAEWPG